MRTRLAACLVTVLLAACGGGSEGPSYAEIEAATECATLRAYEEHYMRAANEALVQGDEIPKDLNEHRSAAFNRGAKLGCIGAEGNWKG